MMTPQVFAALSVNITNRNPTLSVGTNNRRFRATFGSSSPWVCSESCCLIAARGNTQEKIKPSHLLWTLCFLKLYASENVVSAMCDCDEKTLRKGLHTIAAIVWLDQEPLATFSYEAP
jgi:hypothetical protein